MPKCSYYVVKYDSTDQKVLRTCFCVRVSKTTTTMNLGWGAEFTLVFFPNLLIRHFIRIKYLLPVARRRISREARGKDAGFPVAAISRQSGDFGNVAF